MSEGNSRHITTTQTSPHEQLEAIVRKHQTTKFQKPFADHTQAAFTHVHDIVTSLNKPIIIDACCGTGDSTRWLARKYPSHIVIGIDRSAHRLSKERSDENPNNMLLIRADLVDFYRLACAASWTIDYHFLLYPNPYPKAAQLQRRWHASPVFPDMIKLGGTLELRPNWLIYAEEFHTALRIAGQAATIEKITPEADYLTLFEKKYDQSGQELYRLVANL